MRLRRLLVPFLALLLLPPAAAAGDGPPTSRDAGRDGVLEPSGRERLTALFTSFHTVLARTLVLMQPARRLPRRLSRFAVVDVRGLALRRRIVLEGDWSFDALSPDASTLYLTQALGRKADRYAVRAYDLRAHRLVKDPVVDPAEPDEPLRGWPVTRTTGPGGRWEYTLYVGGHEPFIHALDTVHRTSICIDLPRRVGRAKRVWSFRLELRAGRIAVVDRNKVVASTARRPQQASAGGGPPWIAAIVAATGLLAAAGVRRARRNGA